MLKIVSEIEKVNRKEWDDFIINHSRGNIFQTPAMAEVYVKTINYQPVVLFCINDQENLVGVLVAVIQKEYKGPLGMLSSRSIITGGPLALNDSGEITEFLLKHYVNILKHKAIYTQIRNLGDHEVLVPLYGQCGFCYEDHLDIHIDLKKSEDQLWKELHPKRRNEIRKAYSLGVTVKVIDSADDIKEAYHILTEVYKRAKLPLADESLFLNAFRILDDKGYLRVFGAYHNGVLIGIMFTLCYNRTIIDWYAGSYEKHYDKYPNDIIPWEVIRWGKQNNYTLFDFGGAGKPGIPYGVRDYKKKFGGEVVNFGRFELVHKPMMMKIAVLGLKVWQYLKGSK